MEGTSLGSQLQPGHERIAADSTAQALCPAEKVTTNQPAASSGRVLEPPPSSGNPGHQHISKQPDKARVSASAGVVVNNGNKASIVDAKRKVKRKSESDLGEIHVHPMKLPSPYGKERSSSQKTVDQSSLFPQRKTNIQFPGASMSSDQQS